MCYSRSYLAIITIITFCHLTVLWKPSEGLQTPPWRISNTQGAVVHSGRRAVNDKNFIVLIALLCCVYSHHVAEIKYLLHILNGGRGLLATSIRSEFCHSIALLTL